MANMLKQIGVLGLFLIICFTAAAIGGLFTATSVGSWYESLTKPSWNPPNWVFAPVWTTLYMMIAIAGWLIWRERGFKGARWPLMLFLTQLLLNVAWSGLFFGLQNPGLAFAEIVVLWLAILLTTISFFRIALLPGVLFLPYLLWVTFATVLNFEIWRLAVVAR